MYSKKTSDAALLITDENEEEFKIEGRASSLDCYSENEDLP